MATVAELQAELAQVNTAIANALDREVSGYTRGRTSYAFHRLSELRRHRQHLEVQIAELSGNDVALAVFQESA